LDYIAIPTCKTPAASKSIIATVSTQKPSIVFNVQLIGSIGNTIDISALQDSGAEGTLIHPQTIAKHRLTTTDLPRPIPVQNVDGSMNINGPITKQTTQQLRLNSNNGTLYHDETTTFLVTNTGEHDIILGTDWLATHNPQINWTDNRVDLTRCSDTCALNQPPVTDISTTTRTPRTTVEDVVNQDDLQTPISVSYTLLRTFNDGSLHPIAVATTYTDQLNPNDNTNDPTTSLKD
jgi:hypothetical protein